MDAALLLAGGLLGVITLGELLPAVASAMGRLRLLPVVGIAVFAAAATIAAAVAVNGVAVAIAYARTLATNTIDAIAVLAGGW